MQPEGTKRVSGLDRNTKFTFFVKYGSNIFSELKNLSWYVMAILGIVIVNFKLFLVQSSWPWTRDALF